MSSLKIIFVALSVSLAVGCSSGGNNDSLSSDPTAQNTPNSNDTPAGSNNSGAGTGAGNDSTKSVTLNWSVPTTREDGTPLNISEVGGYEIYYFQDGTALDQGESHTISNPSITTFTTPDLELGLYYFAIASFDTNGLASELSEPIAASLN